MAKIASLKEICKMFVIRKGITRIDLPTTLAEEVEEMEGRIKLIFTGTFHKHENFSVIPLTIAWAQGQWELTMKNQETVVIQSGVENSLSQLGGELFMLPVRTASIVDFRLDLGTKTLRFNGSCSSSKDPRGRSLTIVMHFGKVLEINVQCRSIDRPTTVTKNLFKILSREGSSDSDSDDSDTSESDDGFDDICYTDSESSVDF